MWDRPKLKVLFDDIWATTTHLRLHNENSSILKGNDWESDTPLSLSFFSMSGFSPTQLAMLVIAWMQGLLEVHQAAEGLHWRVGTKAAEGIHFLSRNEGRISGLLLVLLQLSLCFCCRVFLLITKNRFRPAVQQSGNRMVGFCLNWKGFGIPKSFKMTILYLFFRNANILTHWLDFGPISWRSSLLSLLPSCGPGQSALWLSLCLWPSSCELWCCRGSISPHNCGMEVEAGDPLDCLRETKHDLSSVGHLDIS